MRNYLIISIALLLVMGCGKDKVGAKPELKLENVSSTGVPKNSLLQFNFSFITGIAADSIYVEKVVPDCPATAFEDAFKVPQYPSSVNKGQMQVTFVNGYADEYIDLRGPTCGQNDTVTFRFVLRDIKGNVSDTITSPQIVIYL